MCDLEVGMATVFALGALELPFADAAIMAFSSFSVTPDPCRRISSLAVVSNFVGVDWIAASTTDSAILFFTIATTSSLVRAF
jgi:hypothetical protein